MIRTGRCVASSQAGSRSCWRAGMSPIPADDRVRPTSGSKWRQRRWRPHQGRLYAPPPTLFFFLNGADSIYNLLVNFFSPSPFSSHCLVYPIKSFIKSCKLCSRILTCPAASSSNLFPSYLWLTLNLYFSKFVNRGGPISRPGIQRGAGTSEGDV